MSVKNDFDSSSTVEKAIHQHGTVSEERLVGILMERMSVSPDKAKSAITEAMMDGRVYITKDDTVARTGFYDEDGWE